MPFNGHFDGRLEEAHLRTFATRCVFLTGSLSNRRAVSDSAALRFLIATVTAVSCHRGPAENAVPHKAKTFSR